MCKVLEVPSNVSINRLDRYLAWEFSDMSRTRIRKLIESNFIRSEDGKPLKPSSAIYPGMRILVDIPPPDPYDVEPENIPLDILFEDKDILVLNKAPGMSVHPSGPHRTGTLVNAILGYCTDLSGIGGISRPGIVHRLDKVTSGVIIIAKNDKVHCDLSMQFKNRCIRKTYWAIVKGVMEESEGVWDGPIGRHPKLRKRMAVRESGKSARTEFKVLERYPGYTWLSIHPVTGRTHQIRTHLEAAGFSIINDKIYGWKLRKGEDPEISSWLRNYPGIALHARSIEFTHPTKRIKLFFEANPIEKWQELKNILNIRKKMIENALDY